jgi:hypothetical protein
MDTYLMLFRCIPVFFLAIVALLVYACWLLRQIHNDFALPKGWTNAKPGSKPQREPGGTKAHYFDTISGIAPPEPGVTPGSAPKHGNAF